MKPTQRKKDEIAFVEWSLADSIICQKCNATLDTFADACTSGLQVPCPGYLAIEQAKRDFAVRGDKYE